MSYNEENHSTNLVNKYKKYDSLFINSDLSKNFKELLPKYFSHNTDLKSEVELLKLLNTVSSKIGFDREPTSPQNWGQYSIYKSYWNFENYEFFNNCFTTKLQFYIIATLLSIHEFKDSVKSGETIDIAIITTQRPCELYPIDTQGNEALLSYTKEFDNLTTQKNNGRSIFNISRFFLVKNSDDNDLWKGLLTSKWDLLYEYCESKKYKDNICKDCINRSDCVNKRKEFLSKNPNTNNYFFSITQTPPNEFYTELIAFGIKQKNNGIEKVNWKRAFISDLNRLTTSLSIQIMNNEEINSKKTSFLGCNDKTVLEIIEYYNDKISDNTDLKKQWTLINKKLSV